MSRSKIKVASKSLPRGGLDGHNVTIEELIRAVFKAELILCAGFQDNIRHARKSGHLGIYEEDSRLRGNDEFDGHSIA